MLIDCHAHLDSPEFDHDRAAVIERAWQARVSAILNVGTTLEASQKALDLAARYEWIYAAVGIHPHEATEVTDADFEALRRLAAKPEVVAIGETGLDYFRDHAPGEAQRALFRRHIRLARELNKPVIVHCRDAWEDALAILKEEGAAKAGGVIHCFSGDRALALQCVDRGFFVSFAGPLTYPKADPLRDAARAVPSQRLFVETDSPYLAPQSGRGKRNEPAFVQETAKRLAEIKGVSLEDLGRILTDNLARLFGIGETGTEDCIVYRIRNSLYVNVTGRCPNACVFCTREESPVVAGYDLKLNQEPLAQEAIRRIGDPSLYDEVVFCGYGEPLERLDFIKTVAGWVKNHRGRVRINTNGQGNLIHKRNILPELRGLVDTLSISLNAETEEKYRALCRPRFGRAAFPAIKEFIREAGQTIPEVIATAVKVPDAVDVEACERMARDELGVKFRCREFNVVG